MDQSAETKKVSDDQNLEQVETKDEAREKKGKGKYILLGIILVFVILGAGVVGFFLSESKRTKQVAINTTTKNLNPRDLIEIKNTAKVPSKYVYINSAKNIVVGDLNSKKEYVVVKSAVDSKFWSNGKPQVSPDGKYLTYVSVPESQIAEWEANPPIEIHGYSNLDVHLVDISNLNSPKDKVVEKNAVWGMGVDDTITWTPDSKSFYVHKYEDEDNVYCKYDLGSSSCVNIQLPVYYAQGSYLSPSGDQYLKMEATGSKDIEDSTLNSEYNLILSNLDGSNKRTVYPKLITNEYSVLFLDDNTAFIAREVFHNGPNSTCYIDKIDLKTGTVKNLEERNCPPGASYTNFSMLKVSPNGKYLSAAYRQDGLNNSDKGSLFIYNLKTGSKKTVGDLPDSYYYNYYWLSNDSILGLINKYSQAAQKTTNEAILIDVNSGEASDYSLLDDKFIDVVY